ncbi:hypothetical protein BPAE_0368g00050 [Botrytis paeoniae]|uniref:Uncharacterized protein n=1 Tax=Botrytis paeoniae TaxID=278948 RepID=A0A4Z1F5K4_9HELO|nr:hypothetical protein BPAE_0368g00050 [Botrytis paeoniae]
MTQNSKQKILKEGQGKQLNPPQPHSDSKSKSPTPEIQTKTEKRDHPHQNLKPKHIQNLLGRKPTKSPIKLAIFFHSNRIHHKSRKTGNTHQLLISKIGTQNHIASSGLSVAATIGLSDYFGSIAGGNDVAARAGGVAAVAARIEGVGVGARGHGEGVGEEEGEEGEGDSGELHFDSLVLQGGIPPALTEEALYGRPVKPF